MVSYGSTSSGSLLGDGALNIQGGSLVVAGRLEKNLFIQGNAYWKEISLETLRSVMEPTSPRFKDSDWSTASPVVMSASAQAVSMLNKLSVQDGALRMDIGNHANIRSFEISADAIATMTSSNGEIDDVQIGTLRLDGLLNQGSGGATITTGGMSGAGVSGGDVAIRGIEIFREFFGPGVGDVLGLRPGNSPGTLTIASDGYDALTVELFPETPPDDFLIDELPAIFEFEIADANGRWALIGTCWT